MENSVCHNGCVSHGESHKTIRNNQTLEKRLNGGERSSIGYRRSRQDIDKRCTLKGRSSSNQAAHEGAGSRTFGLTIMHYRIDAPYWIFVDYLTFLHAITSYTTSEYHCILLIVVSDVRTMLILTCGFVLTITTPLTLLSTTNSVNFDPNVHHCARLPNLIPTTSPSLLRHDSKPYLL